MEGLVLLGLEGGCKDFGLCHGRVPWPHATQCRIVRASQPLVVRLQEMASAIFLWHVSGDTATAPQQETARPRPANPEAHFLETR